MITQVTKQLGLVLAGMTLPALCFAEASDFNYLEGSHQQGEVSDLDVDGWAVAGSFELTENLFVAGGARTIELNESTGFDLDASEVRLGLGYVFGQNTTGSVYGRASYLRVETEASFGGVSADDEEDGYELTLGMRMNLSPEAELNASVSHLELDGGGSDTVPEVGLVYSFTENFAGLVNYIWKDDDNLLGLGIRFYF